MNPFHDPCRAWPPAPQLPLHPIQRRSSLPGSRDLPAPWTSYPWIVNPMAAPAVARPLPPGVLYPYFTANYQPIPVDLRKNPRKANPTEFLRHHRYSVFSQPVTGMQLVCRCFPWPITIKDEWVLCGTIWEKIYASLQEYLMPSEWAMASEGRRKKIERAVRLREAETGNRNLKPRRIDWLGEKTIFVGLEKDDGFVKEVTMPFIDDNTDTWIIRLAKR